MNNATAVLLIAHGSRRSEANDDLVQLAEILRGKQVYPIVETAYLEVAEPGIVAAAEKCIEAGASRVKMLPYFLSAGAHVTDDLEQHRRELAVRFPRVMFELCPPLGLHSLMVDIVMDRLRVGEAPQGKSVSDEPNTEAE